MNNKTLKNERLKLSFIYFISMLLIVIVRIIYAENLVPSYSYLFSILVQIFALGAIPLFLYIFFLKQNNIKKPLRYIAKSCGYTKNISKTDWIKVIIISLISPFLIVCISSTWQTLLYLIGYKTSSGTGGEWTVGVFFAELFFTCVLPATFEEFVNRGILFHAYRDSKSKWRVILLTALMFALMHQQIRQVGYTFVSGIIAGALVYRTKSIYPAMVYHFTNNFLSVLTSYGQSTGNFFSFINKFYNFILGTVGGVILGIFLFIIISIIIYVLIISINEKPKKLKAYKVYDTTLYLPKDTDISSYYNVKPIKHKKFENIFIYATIIMNTTITIYTLITGIML